MSVMITGAAGFIGYHVAQKLLAQGQEVIVVDNVNDYYDVVLKKARLKELEKYPNMIFYQQDIADKDGMLAIVRNHPSITEVIHLAAQAGVRYSLKNPLAYTHSNITGHVVILEICRRLSKLKHLVFASSSSVYGSNSMLPFSVRDEARNPISLYAATKLADELMTYSYSHLYDIPSTGLRFFTVYGPWGRPDMAAYLFAKAIMAGEPITLFNNGELKRDFTYIDDIVNGVVAALRLPPVRKNDIAPYKIYNLGNNKSEPITRFLQILEESLGRKATILSVPMQPGDMKETLADIEETSKHLGFFPVTPIETGIPRFAKWFVEYEGVVPYSVAQGL